MLRKDLSKFYITAFVIITDIIFFFSLTPVASPLSAEQTSCDSIRQDDKLPATGEVIILCRREGARRARQLKRREVLRVLSRRAELDQE